MDRNVGDNGLEFGGQESLSARRAWIEMRMAGGLLARLRVALRKESVDRNKQRRDFKRLGLRRSPQGERG